ncbi:hypothetical protein JX265_006770 [Neoarthrinium moseri]|uniref:Uncharacterized protein n=1 Tax=Neoarthrinium moseri TaxID=1658444 RepID=A0A9P9WL90_9PEZI|nr:uncharacterized protein JN550_002756 [Neoarthrinium moseri]KAI1847035.1 hypothetical protein JX266_006910 [Neoarthrinium moseri]KAI1868791.1 hypothetical protein JX265_006770 [Neoarthrinium moseri]KAI1874177.1 hypothetical protein JN550_002756 [Neoarthrinium moseri]
MKKPFRSDEPMNGPPSCTIADFMRPHLRKCTFAETIRWEKTLGYGLDGYVWKVWFGDKGPFALKMFWDTDPPEYNCFYYALQRECQNAAIFQMIECAMEKHEGPGPIWVFDDPETQIDAKANLRGFSDEMRLDERPANCDTVEIKSMPRIRKCYGWLTLSQELLQTLPRRCKVTPYEVDDVERYMSSDMDYAAIVYEYVEPGKNEVNVVEEVDRFFWLTGFGHTISPKGANWESGVLIDGADIVYAGGYGWKAGLYGARKAKDILRE